MRWQSWACTGGCKRVNGGELYEFTAVYTLARLGDDLKIIAIAHDELAKIRAASLTIRVG